MAEIMDVNAQWSSRPMDERYVSLIPMLDKANRDRVRSQQINTNLSQFYLESDKANSRALTLVSKRNGAKASMTNFAFSQLTVKAGAPKGFLSTLPGSLAADVMNYKLTDANEDVGVYMHASGDKGAISGLEARAFTSQKYGRINDADVIKALVSRFGDGTGKDSDWKVPGEFGKDVVITQDNTTLFKGDRDMHVFLCDEKNRIELPNRRDGKSGNMARGFIVQNSEVGYATLSVKFFLFDYVCSNRIIWGATDIKTITLRHSKDAPERFADEIAPVLVAYHNSATEESLAQLTLAQSTIIDSDHDKVLEFLTNRVKGLPNATMKQARAINAIHLAEESRPIETIWDAVTGITAYARSIPYQDERVSYETAAGKLIEAVN